MNRYMKQAKENADKGIANKEGGPFGAVIVDKEGKIVANGNNKMIFLTQMDRDECIKTMQQYEKDNGVIY